MLDRKKNIKLKMLCAGWTQSVGNISADLIKEHLFPPSPETLVLLCGPPAMIDSACKPNLDKLGYDSKLRFDFNDVSTDCCT
jgi:cytochrome-b5 reductase